MSTLKKVVTVVAVLVVAVPATSWACLPCLFGCGMPWNQCGCPPCVGCHQLPAACTCAVPVVPMQTTLRPVVQTQYRQQQFVTYRDVATVQVRREAYMENVPVTTYQQVTETVYVPQQVTKLVPQTTLQAQTRYRDVAYQATQRIPEVQTRLVPQQSIGYVPELQPVSSFAGTFAPLVSTAPPVPVAYPTAVTPIVPAAAIPSMPPLTVSPSGANVLVPQYPDAPATSGGWPVPATRTQPTPAARGAFRPAPSAATVWQSKF